MADLYICNVDLLNNEKFLVALSDGRTLTFSMDQLLTLEPLDVIFEEESDL